MPAKKSSKKNGASTKFGGASDALGELGYSRCLVCRRDVKDTEAHAALHKNGTLGDDGRRTDRSAAEAKTWAERFNGSNATEQFRVAKTKKTVAKKAAKKSAKKSAKKAA